MHHLVVVRPFGKYRVGDVIEDNSTMEKVLASEHVDHVVRIVPQSKG